MNRSFAVSAIAACGLFASTASADLVITEVMAQTTAGTASAINGDWWELTNSGPAAVTLGGYQWADSEDALGGATPQPNFFAAITIGAGESIIITEEVAASEDAWRTNWNAPSTLVILSSDEMIPAPGSTDTFSGLGSGADSVNFYDPSGVLISTFSYAAVTRGVSFEMSMSGSDLGLSVVGENGAVLAANSDIGSPGAAVPTPGTLALIGVAAVAARRRR